MTENNPELAVERIAVRMRGREMDDRLEIVEAEVCLHVAGRTEPLRYFRSAPIWRGLVCGLHSEIPRVDASP